MSAGNGRPVEEDDLLRLVDGRLDPERLAVVERWLADHPDAAARVIADRTFHDALREQLAGIADEPIPERLRVANLLPLPAVRQRTSWRPAAAAAMVWLALGAAAGWVGRAALQKEHVSIRSKPGPTIQDAVAAFRTYVPEAVHPVEVKADQTPHLEQWLSKRMGEPIAAPDLSAQGFSLMGGRIVPTGDTPAALLMYDDAQGTRLTLYARMGTTAPTSLRYAREGDVDAVSWSDDDCSYVVAARMDKGRLLSIAEVVEAQLHGNAQKP